MRGRTAASGAPARLPADPAVIWHEVECGGYAADLALWREAAQAAPGPLLDLGCGTGRVALDLAARGRGVVAVDSDPALVRALLGRARERHLRVRAIVADVRALAIDAGGFSLAIAPMQVAQLLGGIRGRRRMLASVRERLAPGALLLAALADPLEGAAPEASLPPLPDAREQDGWVFSSTPVAVRALPDGVRIDRRREAVSPAGDLWETMASVHLDRLEPGELETEAERLGYRVGARRGVPATDAHVGSAVAVLEAV